MVEWTPHKGLVVGSIPTGPTNISNKIETFMTNKELIEHLSTLDPNMQIMVRGYEGGCQDLKIDQIKQVVVLLGYHQGCKFYGDHEHYDLDDWIDPDDLEQYTKINAIMLDRW